MNNVVKKDIILVPGSKVAVKEVDGKSVLTIYEAVNEPNLFIVYHEGFPEHTIIQGGKRFLCGCSHLIPFESIEQYKDILTGKCEPLEKYKTYETI